MTFSVLTSFLIPYLTEIKKKLEKRVEGLEKERGKKDFLFFPFRIGLSEGLAALTPKCIS